MKKYTCQCRKTLDVPEELVEELERGDEVVLYCENCGYRILINDQDIIEYIPPRCIFFISEQLPPPREIWE